MQKVMIVDGQGTIQSYCKEAVVSLVDDSAFQAEGIATIFLTIREESMHSESRLALVVRKRATDYAVAVGPAGEGPMIQYFFSDEYINTVKRSDL